MRRLSDEVTEYLQLFQAVLPAFIEALPPWLSAAPNDPKQEILKNVITILRFKTNEMQQVMIPACWDYDLTDVDISRVSDAVEDVLFSLEDLVLMNTDVQLVRALISQTDTRNIAIIDRVRRFHPPNFLDCRC